MQSVWLKPLQKNFSDMVGRYRYLIEKGYKVKLQINHEETPDQPNFLVK